MDHVHAHPTPGNLRDFFGGGKPGLQNELQQLVIADLRTGFDHAALDGLAAHRIQVDTGTVVAHFDNDIAALVGQAQLDSALLRLAEGATLFRAFQAMINRITQHVFQWRNHTLQHAAIHFAFGVADFETDLFIQFACHLAHDPPQARQQPLERHHARAHQAFLQLGVDPGLLQ